MTTTTVSTANSFSMGVLPGWWRPFVAKLPWYTQGRHDVRTLAGIAIMAVAKRLATTTDRVDLLSKLQESRDGNGNSMGKAELTAEALVWVLFYSLTRSSMTAIIIR
jgi:benzoate 4-monooxygenase